MRLRAEPTVVVHQGVVGEGPALYTRLLVGDPAGRNAGRLFLTWERRLSVADPGGPTFPILCSTDAGRTWAEIASVADAAHGVGNRYQPMLFELPVAVAHLERGDLLLAGNAIPADGSFTCLVLYSSRDSGVSWNLESVIDTGGPAIYDSNSDADTTAIWEPDLRVVDGELHCYFADERRKGDGMLQTIVRRRTQDLRTWSEPELICGIPNRYQRPGMFVGTGPLPAPGGGTRHLAVVEIVGPRDVPVHLLASADGVNWGDPADLGRLLVARDGVSLSGTPNLAWYDGRSGPVIIATGRHSLRDGQEGNRALVSTDLGVTWDSFELPTAAIRRIHGDGSGYSQSVRWVDDSTLVQATTLRNGSGSHDVVVTRAHILKNQA
jgi:hypothetical protein